MDTENDCTGPINLGNPNETTIKKLAELIISLTGSGSNIIYKALPSDDPVKRKPDINKAISVLGWEPETDLISGLENTINYFKKRN